MNLFLVWLLQHYIIAIFPCGLKDNLAHGVVWTAILMKTRGGNQVEYFSTVILKEHQVGWSTFGLSTGHFWGSYTGLVKPLLYGWKQNGICAQESDLLYPLKLILHQTRI